MDLQTDGPMAAEEVDRILVVPGGLRIPGLLPADDRQEQTSHRNHRSVQRLVALLTAGLLLAACSGDGRSTVSPPSVAPASTVTTMARTLTPASKAGAQGPMQFLPSTWTRYGRGGDIQATGDAILAAARLLRANGAPADMAAALYAYNPSRRYVRAVSAHASQLRANPRAFLGYYHWQVFYGDTLLPEGYPTRPATPTPG
jgi:hypothetical protein